MQTVKDFLNRNGLAYESIGVLNQAAISGVIKNSISEFIEILVPLSKQESVEVLIEEVFYPALRVNIENTQFFLALLQNRANPASVYAADARSNPSAVERIRAQRSLGGVYLTQDDLKSLFAEQLTARPQAVTAAGVFILPPVSAYDTRLASASFTSQTAERDNRQAFTDRMQEFINHVQEQQIPGVVTLLCPLAYGEHWRSAALSLQDGVLSTATLRDPLTWFGDTHQDSLHFKSFFAKFNPAAVISIRADGVQTAGYTCGYHAYQYCMEQAGHTLVGVSTEQDLCRYAAQALSRNNNLELRGSIAEFHDVGTRKIFMSSNTVVAGPENLLAIADDWVELDAATVKASIKNDQKANPESHIFYQKPSSQRKPASKDSSCTLL